MYYDGAVGVRGRGSSDAMGALTQEHIDQNLWTARVDINDLTLESGLWLSLSSLYYNIETGEILRHNEDRRASTVASTGLFGFLSPSLTKKHSKNR